MLHPLKRCLTFIMSNEGMKIKAASMLVYSPFVAAFVATRLASAVWAFSVVVVLKC
ncbi:hypothetical protein LguiB_023190 [Lonicera macranthoides]